MAAAAVSEAFVSQNNKYMLTRVLWPPERRHNEREVISHNPQAESVAQMKLVPDAYHYWSWVEFLKACKRGSA